ncbi:adenylate/guanylate cyclase domain-containing protein [Bradyrhizobium sp. WSM1743]|uniref:adenylate/guanylate cyclase domain-containing protein n=1 Tax=Bradyrhizobium sp. WSM1743 TaxID=318996 RepID=UPI0004876ABF|nr:adenylate/guanylate cyclase domain-containing protein [Bradyrhizobium sp. WSM1743]
MQSGQQDGERIPNYVRMDFAWDIVSLDETTQTFRAIVKPDPRRYETLQMEDGLYYRDKYLDFLVSEECLNSMSGVAGLPMYCNSPTIKSASDYTQDRRTAIESQLQSGIFIAPNSEADQHRQLAPEDPVRNVTFLSVDICGSTKLRARNGSSYDRAYTIFFQELGSVVGQFHGTILTSTGDGFIAYITSQSVNVQCDNALDMGLTFLAVLEGAVNPALEAAGLPSLSIRVGADHGVAVVSELNVPSTGFSERVMKSDGLNRCAKINGKAKAGQFLIGRELYERIHVQWLERCSEVSVDLAGAFGFENYEIYSVT